MRTKKLRRGKVFVISGPSGSGKSTLVKKLLSDRALKHKFAHSISFTTRPQRSYERNGKDYFFISPRQFKRYLQAKKILEWTKYLGYYYATPKLFLEEQLARGKNILLCLDFKGMQKVKRLYPQDSTTIFVLPPSITELHKRIKNRCSRTRHEEISCRLEMARKEIAAVRFYDYRLVNKDLNRVTQKIKKIILDKTKA